MTSHYVTQALNRAKTGNDRLRAMLEQSAMKTLTLTAPSHWASYLINGDASGLEPDEKAACDAWLAREAIGWPVSCEDAGFCWRHDAMPEALAADCQEYTFLPPRLSAPAPSVLNID